MFTQGRVGNGSILLQSYHLQPALQLAEGALEALEVEQGRLSWED